jgi:hypothetical protein
MKTRPDVLCLEVWEFKQVRRADQEPKVGKHRGLMGLFCGECVHSEMRLRLSGSPSARIHPLLEECSQVLVLQSLSTGELLHEHNE